MTSLILSCTCNRNKNNLKEMENEYTPIVETQMLIKKPVDEVFNSMYQGKTNKE